MKIKCNSRKPLIHGDGTESFTPGKIYDVVNPYAENITDQTTAWNNQGQPHNLGSWFTKFKKI